MFNHAPVIRRAVERARRRPLSTGVADLYSWIGRSIPSGECDVHRESAQTTLGAVILLLCIGSTAMPAEAAPRFFASALQCESARVLAPGACRTAFANALAEFDAKAPSFRSRRACFKQFGPCMPWPMGTRRFDEFRPQWVGATVEADTVLPATAPGRVRLQFAPQSLASLSPGAVHQAPETKTSAEPQVRILTPPADDGPSTLPPARAGAGFTVIDGVLTYPAPARFQPRNLKHP